MPIKTLFAVLLTVALIALLVKRFPRPQMTVAMALVFLITMVMMDLLDHWPLLEWTIREAFALVRLWLTT